MFAVVFYTFSGLTAVLSPVPVGAFICVLKCSKVQTPEGSPRIIREYFFSHSGRFEHGAGGEICAVAGERAVFDYRDPDGPRRPAHPSPSCALREKSKIGFFPANEFSRGARDRRWRGGGSRKIKVFRGVTHTQTLLKFSN